MVMKPILGVAVGLLITEAVNAGAPLYRDISTIALPLAVLGNNSMDVEMADINQDGALDVFIACEFCPNLILINDGHGVFTDESITRFPQPQPSRDSEDIAVADYNRDGHMDVLFVSEDDQTNQLYFNDGSGVFIDETSRLGVTGTSNATLALDIDRDDDTDILIGNAGPNVVLINDGNGQFTNQSAARLPPNNETTQDIEAGDIDGDGDPDLIVGSEDGNRLWQNNGNGGFSDVTVTHLPLVAGEETREADFGDIDNDGDLDLVFANVKFAAGSTGRNRLFTNNGCGQFTDVSAAALPVFSLNSVDVDFIDVDGDGDLDMLMATAFDGSFQAFINNGVGVFTESSNDILPVTATGSGIDVEAADLNGDGAEEVYLSIFQGADHLIESAIVIPVIFGASFEGVANDCS